jgi:hypothetical protein
VSYAPIAVGQLLLLPQQLLLLQENLILNLLPKNLIGRKDAVSNSVSNLIGARPAVALTECGEDAVPNSVSNLLGAWSIVALTERRSGKRHYRCYGAMMISLRLLLSGPRTLRRARSKAGGAASMAFIFTKSIAIMNRFRSLL